MYLDFRMAFDTISQSVFIWSGGGMSKVNALLGGLNWLDHRAQISCSLFVCKMAKSGILCKVILGLMFSMTLIITSFLYEEGN